MFIKFHFCSLISIVVQLSLQFSSNLLVFLITFHHVVIVFCKVSIMFHLFHQVSLCCHCFCIVLIILHHLHQFSAFCHCFLHCFTVYVHHFLMYCLSLCCDVFVMSFFPYFILTSSVFISLSWVLISFLSQALNLYHVVTVSELVLIEGHHVSHQFSSFCSCFDLALFLITFHHLFHHVFHMLSLFSFAFYNVSSFFSSFSIMCHCICTAFSRLHYFSHPCLWFRHCCVHVCFLFLIICFISFHLCAIDCILLFFMFHHLSHQFSSVCNCFIIVFIIFIDFSHHLSPFRHCFHVLFIMCHHFYHHVSWFCHCSVQFLSYFIMSLIGFHQFVIVNKCGCFVSCSCFSICCIMVSLFLIQFLYVLIMVRHSSYQCS